MEQKIEEILEIWHKHYEDEENQYSEYEPSDIEYFVGCMLYNHFAFSKAHPNMKTIDLSYDFLQTCGDENYKKAQEMVATILFDDEMERVKYLQNYLDEARSRYLEPELYLLNRLKKHVDLMQERYEKGADAIVVDFQAMYKMA